MKSRFFVFKIVITIFLVLGFESMGVARTFDVTIVSTKQVVCNIGDTLKFYGSGNGDYVTINGHKVLTSVPSSPPYLSYIGQYIISTGDSSFCISNAEGPWCGTITIVDNIDLSEICLGADINIYPNPVKDVLSISDIQSAQIKIIGLTGVIFKKIEFKNTSIMINIGDLQPGIYFVEIVSDKGRKLYKILKQ